MSRVTGKPPTARWRRPMTRTYDYNMALGENYYKPQLDYISARKSRGRTPPSATTFAERLLRFPPSQRSASATRRGEESEFGAGTSSGISMTAAKDESLGRYSSLDDLGLDEDMTFRRRRQLLQASQENLAGADRGLSPLLSPKIGERRNRVTFGDKMLDAVGVSEGSSTTQQSSSSMTASSKGREIKSLMSVEEGDAIDKILSERRNRRQGGLALTIKSADPDLFSEDPLKSPGISSRLQQARQQMDEMRDEMRKEADSSTSKFRQRLRAKRDREMKEEQELQQQQLFGSLSALNDNSMSLSSSSKNTFSSARNAGVSSSGLKLTSNISSSAQNLMSMADDDDAETAAILSKVEQIRKRAKARLAQITDDFGDLEIESSLASRRAASRARALMDDDFDTSAMGGTSGRTLNIKRTLKATSSYDME